jgi:hypothetical protein
MNLEEETMVRWKHTEAEKIIAPRILHLLLLSVNHAGSSGV